MPTKSTRSRGAITSRMPLPAAAATSAGLGLCGADEVAARLLIRVELHQPFRRCLLEQIRERAKAIVRLVEAGLAALESLLDHRAPDALVLAALGDERVERLEHELERFLLLVLAGGGGVAAFLRPAALLLLRP